MRSGRAAWLCASCLALACGSSGCKAGPARTTPDAMAAEAGAGDEPALDSGEASLEAGAPDADTEMRDAARSQREDASSGSTIDQAAPSFAAANGVSWEGSGEWRVEVKLARPAERALSYALQTSGSATSGADYKLPAALAFAAGASSAQLTIAIVDDRERESLERLTLTLGQLTPAVSYTLAIADDDDDRWPTSDTVTQVDAARAFAGANLSGLVYAPARGGTPADLWLVRNGPSQLYRLRENGGLFSALTSDGWAAGKTLLFAHGGGAPDAEGITMADWSSPLLYAISERDGAGPSVPAVLAFDTSASGASLTATRSWDLSDDLRALMLGSNTGPEALTWIPDSYLTAAGFFDEARNAPYDPARYANHAGGLFVVGIEQTGGLYAYALDHVTGAATRVAQITSGLSSVVALEFDRDTNYLWAWCDDGCGNRATILRIEENPSSPKRGRFGVRRTVNRPASLPDLNHEGMTFAPGAECKDGKKAVFWIEDGPGDHVLRRGSVPCAAFLEME